MPLLKKVSTCRPGMTVAGTVVLALGVVLTGCSSAQSDDAQSPVQAAAEQARSAGLDFQARILEDGSITDAEYADAIDAEVSCISQAGISVTTPQLSLADSQRYTFEMTPQPGVAEGNVRDVETKCRAEWLDLVEDQYFATNKPRMDAALMAGVQDCLRGLGVPVSGNETNIPDLSAAPANATGDQLTTCIQSTGQVIYPGIPIPFMF